MFRHSSVIAMLHLTLAIGAPLLFASTAAAQANEPPQPFSNLQVLPSDIEWPDLQRLMRSFNVALGGGIGCLRCHVGTSGQPISTWDFASDERLSKRKARVMLRMVNAINEGFLASLPERADSNLAVTCATCHAGRTIPRPLRDELMLAYEADGIDSLVQAYRTLRVGYYEQGAYDFSIFPLRSVAAQLRQRGSLEDATAVAQLNVDAHPTNSLVVRRLMEYDIEAEIIERGPEAGIALYLGFRRRGGVPFRSFDWSLLNNVGYRLLGAERVEESVPVFRHNAERYSSTWQVYDSLGEALAVNGDTALAIENYERSVEMNPQNAGGIRALQMLRR